VCTVTCAVYKMLLINSGNKKKLQFKCYSGQKLNLEFSDLFPLFIQPFETLLLDFTGLCMSAHNTVLIVTMLCSSFLIIDIICTKTFLAGKPHHFELKTEILETCSGHLKPLACLAAISKICMLTQENVHSFCRGICFFWVHDKALSWT
jgi:hypothetical protein